MAVNSDIMPVLSYIGLFALLLWLYNISNFIVVNFYHSLKRLLRLNVRWAELGEWAVITGGSDGIGKAYAEALAGKGFNVILISRTREKLERVAADISEKFSVESRVICADFTGGPELYESLRNSLQGYEVGVLVNNVGMSYDHTEYFHAIPDGLNVMDRLIKSNAVSCTMMTRLVLPGMEKRGRGVIINVSSLTALYPMPLLNVYSASKAYVDYFSRALHYECKDKGIIVQSVLPGYVATKMSNRRISLEIPSAESFVASAISTVGLETYTFGYFAHKIRGAVHEWLRDNMPTRVNMAIALYYMKQSRERYFKKMKKIQKSS